MNNYKKKKKKKKKGIEVRNVQEKTAESLDRVENSNFITESIEAAVRGSSENSQEITSIGVVI